MFCFFFSPPPDMLAPVVRLRGCTYTCSTLYVRSNIPSECALIRPGVRTATAALVVCLTGGDVPAVPYIRQQAAGRGERPHAERGEAAEGRCSVRACGERSHFKHSKEMSWKQKKTGWRRGIEVQGWGVELRQKSWVGVRGRRAGGLKG